MTEQAEQAWLFVAAGSGLLAFLIVILLITVAFRWIEEVERRIATPGKRLDGIRRVWGNGPIGRWMRVTHVFSFFVFRKIPRYGRTAELRMGDGGKAVPVSLKLWATVPMTLFYTLMAIFVISAWMLDLY